MFGLDQFGYKSRENEESLLDQALRQGEALRAAIMQTIIRNEPFYTENSTPETEKPIEISLHEKHACLAYMNGDPMSRDEERQALNTFRSLSGSDICDLTSRSFTTTQSKCKCETCRAYCKLSYNIPPLNLKQSLASSTIVSKNLEKHDHFQLFQYVNSLKVVLYSFTISNEGKTKVCSNNHVQKCKFDDLSVIYFIEYEIPVGISKYHSRKQSRVDSGLNSVNFVKKCSKNLVDDVVYFKQVIIHDVENLNVVNLEEVDVVFNITARTLRQKKSIILGAAKFNLIEVCNSPFLSCLQEVPVFLTGDSPIVVGIIRIQLQLGCDRIYFGKEFIECLQNKENHTKINLESNENLDETFTLGSELKSTKKPKEPLKNLVISPSKVTLKDKPRRKVIIGQKVIKNDDKIKSKRLKPQENIKDDDLSKHVAPNLNSQLLSEKIILFGFIFVSDVEYHLTHTQTYFTCQPFCQQDYVCSNVTQGGCFNYHQLIPYIYDEDFLFNLRENHMIIEFFSTQSASRDEVIGICKVPLHQYYLAFRNPVIVKYLERNNLPVIGTDWYEPIKDVVSSNAVGYAKILVALGSEEQVKNLQQERGFMDDIVKRNKSIVKTTREKVVINKEKEIVTRKSVKNVNVKLQDKKTQSTNLTDDLVVVTPRGKVDKSTAVTPTLALEFNLPTAQNKMADSDKSSITMVDDRLQTIQEYLHQLVELKTTSQTQSTVTNQMEAENDTNLAESQSSTAQNRDVNELNNVNISAVQNGGTIPPKTTAGLLATLQGVMKPDHTAKLSFKAQIIVESALHLPARKKCRARKVKGKIIREELQPSTYVSYEIKDGAVKTSQVVQKSTSPEWYMKHDISIPVDYLTNSNRRLLFKVWRKSNNGSTIPNMQIDTIIGFATVDLTVLLAGLPTIEGWFNIMDFSNKCNGQIKINIIPLEDITKYNNLPSTTNTSYTTTPASTKDTPLIEGTSSPDETFNRALKRKFIELEEISQRLKARLNHVTEDIPPVDDQEVNDESADEFENDINTLCVEEDYELLDFAKEAQDMNMRRVSTSLHEWQQGNSNTTELMITTNQDNDDNSNVEENCIKPQFALQVVHKNENDAVVNITENMKTFVPEVATHAESAILTNSSSSSSSTLDRQLHEGKERIDHLLQRLTSLSMAQKNPVETEVAGFDSRYVSGCSTSQDPVVNSGNLNLEEDIFSELGIESDFDVRKLFNASMGNFNGNLEALVDGSFRDEPDGEGNTTESSSDDKLN